MEIADPDIVCLNEIKTDPTRIEANKYWNAIPSSYE